MQLGAHSCSRSPQAIFHIFHRAQGQRSLANLWPRRSAEVPTMDSSLTEEGRAVKIKIDKYIEIAYGGSGDIEASDVVDFCTHFRVKYICEDKLSTLKEAFKRLEARLSQASGWNPAPPDQQVLAPAPEDPPEITVAPWQLGLTPDHSVKGPSKFVNIMDCVHNFLIRPYNSKREPLDLLFHPTAQVNEVIGDWSMVHSIGMAKSSACRIILEACCELALTDQELLALSPQLKALLRMRAIYDPAANDEEQLLRSMGMKNQQAERARPDPLMWAVKYSKIIARQGAVFKEVIQSKVKAHNADKSEAAKISSEELAFMLYYPDQCQDFLQLLEYHWHNYKVRESAVPLKRLSLIDLSPDLKPKRCPRDNKLFEKIYTWTPEQNYYWLLREIGVFTKNIKEHMRAGKKVNLRGSARVFRADSTPTSHDEVCVFVWFLSEFQCHTTPAQYQDLLGRFQRGHLTKELQEKVKLCDPKLTVKDFRFLTILTGCEVNGQRSTGQEEAELAAEEAELNLVEAKLRREREEWEDYQRAVKAFHAKAHEDKVEANRDFQHNLNTKVDKHCNLVCPVRRVGEEGVQTFLSDSIGSWCEEFAISKESVHTVLIVRFDQLGVHYFNNVGASVRIVADCISQSPEKTVAFIIAPSTGRPGDCYSQKAISQAFSDVEAALNNDELKLRVSPGTMTFDEESLGGHKCKRPGTHQFWFVMSSIRDSQTNEYTCVFDKSYVQRRGKPLADLQVLDRKLWVNPCATLSRAISRQSLILHHGLLQAHALIR